MNFDLNNLTAFGETRPLRDWIDPEKGISEGTIIARLYRGWRPEDAVSVPKNLKFEFADNFTHSKTPVFVEKHATDGKGVRHIKKYTIKWVFRHYTSHSGEYVPVRVYEGSESREEAESDIWSDE